MEKKNLYILWTNADPLTAEHVVMMYSEAAVSRGWWDEVTVIIWGATSKLAAENTDIQLAIEKGQAAGVKYSGCLACATAMGTVEKLTEMGIELIMWGPPFTELLKNDEQIITI